MTDEPFSEPEETREDWVDVRMTDPDAGEWDIDDVGRERAESILTEITDEE